MGTLDSYEAIDRALKFYLDEYGADQGDGIGYTRADFVDFVVVRLFGREGITVEQFYQSRLEVRSRRRARAVKR